MISLIGIYYYFVLSLLFFLVSIKLLLNKKLLASRFLGFQFLNLTILIFISYWTNDDKILAHPHLLKITSPFVYLIAPLAFLFQESVFFPEKKFKYIHLLHFLPFLYNFIELIPFYFSLTDVKIDFIKKIFDNFAHQNISENNFFPLSTANHLYLRLIQYTVYTVIMGIQFINQMYTVPNKILKKNILLIGWLASNLLLKSISLIFSILHVFLPIEEYSMYNWQDLLKNIDYLIMTFFIFYKPHFLENSILKSLHSNKPNLLSPEKIESDLQLFNKIEMAFKNKKYFLEENISPQTISDAIEIPSRKVSQVIKIYSKLTFPDFVNLMRINYIEEQIKTNQEWRNFTFETLALESGFGSRSNFYNAFKKLKNESPKAYFSNIKLSANNSITS